MLGAEVRDRDGHRDHSSAIARGMGVRSSDGRLVGRVDGAAGPWVLVRTGWLSSRQLRLASHRVREVRSNEIVVDLTAAEMENLPPYVTDAEIDRRVWERIGDVPGMDATAVSSIWLCTREAIVTVGGNVTTPLLAVKVIETVLGTPGVLDAVDRLVSDQAIRDHVANELERQRLEVHVDVWLGRVRLSGVVQSESDADRAQRIARGANGVRMVVNDLDVSAGSNAHE